MEILSVTSGGTTETQTLPNQRPEILAVSGTPSDLDTISVEDQEYGAIMRLDGQGVQMLGSVGAIEKPSAFVLPLGQGQGSSTVTISATTAATLSGSGVSVYALSTAQAYDERPIMYQTLRVNQSTEVDFSDFFAVAANFNPSDRISIEGEKGGVSSVLTTTEINALSSFKGAYKNLNGQVIDNTDQSIHRVTITPLNSDRKVYVSRLKV